MKIKVVKENIDIYSIDSLKFCKKNLLLTRVASFMQSISSINLSPAETQWATSSHQNRLHGYIWMKIIGKYLYLFIHLNIERYWKMYLVSKVVPFVGDLEGADQTKGLHSKQTQTHLIIDFVTNQQKPNTKNNRMRK